MVVKGEEDLDISRTHPSLGWLLGALIPIVIALGRAVAVVGALIVGFACLGRGGGGADWHFYAVAGAVFCALAFICRK
jgi:hypothetical protein